MHLNVIISPLLFNSVGSKMTHHIVSQWWLKSIHKSLPGNENPKVTVLTLLDKLLVKYALLRHKSGHYSSPASSVGVALLICTYTSACVVNIQNCYHCYFSGLFYYHGLILIPAWISNYINHNVWDEIICSFPNFNGVTLGVGNGQVISSHIL